MYKKLKPHKKNIFNNNIQKREKTTNLIYIKFKFESVIILITNKYYQNIFYFLSFLPIVIMLLLLVFKT